MAPCGAPARPPVYRYLPIWSSPYQVRSNVLLQPAEAAVVPIALVPEEMPLADLLSQALAGRPELAESRALIAAALERWRQAKVDPWVPNLRLSYANSRENLALALERMRHLLETL